MSGDDWSRTSRGWGANREWVPGRGPAAGRGTGDDRGGFPRRGGVRDEETRERFLADVARDLEAGTLPPPDIARAILRLGREGYVKGWAQVAPFLDHADPVVRRAAIQVLVSDWKMDQYRERCETFAATDPDTDVRRFSSTCLGILFQSTNDRRALRGLAATVKRDGESARVRGAAYVSILRVLGKRGREIPFIGNADDLAARVDWNLVEACAAERWDEVPFASPA